MYRPLPQSEGNVLGYHCSGTITEEEVREIHREIDAALEEHGTIRMLLQISELDMPEGSAILEDLKKTPEYVTQVEKYAIIGDRKWQDGLASITDKLTRGDAEFFPPEEIDRAWEWISK